MNPINNPQKMVRGLGIMKWPKCTRQEQLEYARPASRMGITLETYLHGHSRKEQHRLLAQGHFLASQVFDGVNFFTCESCLEIGSGTGAQTKILLDKFPEMSVTCVEKEAVQIEFARTHLPPSRVCWVQADAQMLPFEQESFDCAFLCWILEHVADPLKVAQQLHRVLKPGSPVVVNEVFNKFFHVSPHSPCLEEYWASFNQKQTEANGHPNIGVIVPSLLSQAGFKRIEAKHQPLWADSRDLQYKEILTDYFENLILSAADLLITEGRVSHQLIEGARGELEVIRKSDHGVLHFGWCQTRAYR